MNDRKEVRRENKQVRSLKRLRTMQSKSKTGTKRFNRLKEKVYNPFLDKSPLNLKGDPIPKYNPTEGVKKGVNKSVLKQQLIFKKNPSPTTGNQSIKMTAAPHEYLFGGGMVKGSFNLAKSLAGKAVSKAKPILKNAATDFGIDQAL